MEAGMYRLLTFMQKTVSAVEQTRLAVIGADEGAKTGGHAEEECAGDGNHFRGGWLLLWKWRLTTGCTMVCW